MKVRLGPGKVSYGSRGNAMYSLELWHDGLNKHRLIRGSDREVVVRAAELQAAQWESRWDAIKAREDRVAHNAWGKQLVEERKAAAAEATANATAELDRLGQLLASALTVRTIVDLESLKDRREFGEPVPIADAPSPMPEAPEFPREPSPHDPAFRPSFGILDALIASRKAKRRAEAQEIFSRAHQAWSMHCEALHQSHAVLCAAHLSERKQMDADRTAKMAEWESRKQAFLHERSVQHAAIDGKRGAYFALDPDAVVEHCDLVLSSSQYPDYFPQEFELQYDVAAHMLIVEYCLPAPQDLPTLKAVKYVAARGEFEEQHISEASRAKTYDSVLYQVILRTVYELFESDTAGALQVISLNGMVTSVDRGTGNLLTSCIASLQVQREDFSETNLAQVDPKVCFRTLRGVGSSKLHGLAPVAPIVALQREDQRFVSARPVALESDVNLAAMDWEDFEHLIRELFEKEFSAHGGEVKVTRASRDGGVDAVVFDPDPIRGGKIVVQAKRYTNTVGVGAVRDLYGTVLNEGATKGILVTTSDYGPDSYAFANGKPLALLSGANLLHMLAKHGVGARINIREAKEQAARKQDA